MDGCAVDKIHVHEEIIGVELVAKYQPVHLAPVFVFHQIETPNRFPPGRE